MGYGLRLWVADSKMRNFKPVTRNIYYGQSRCIQRSFSAK